MGKKLPRSENVGKKLKITDTFSKHETFKDMKNHHEHIKTFHCLLKGREDAFAVRWEKGNKSGYLPAYFYDPYRLRVHKMNGGTFQNFPKVLSETNR